MDPTYQPQQPQRLQYPFHEYIPTSVTPCAIAPNGWRSPFHLLNCGHIIAIRGPDRHCGNNCLHVVWRTPNKGQQPAVEPSKHKGPKQSETALPAAKATAAAAVSPPEAHQQKPALNPTKASPPGIDHPLNSRALVTSRTPNILHCTLCTAATQNCDLTMPLNNNNTLRRAVLPLTQSTLFSVLGSVPMLAPPFRNPRGQSFDWKFVHRLRCGHEVWCVPARPCASNCCSGMSGMVGGWCMVKIFPGNVTVGDAVVCGECIVGAERVERRCAQLMREGHGK